MKNENPTPHPVVTTIRKIWFVHLPIFIWYCNDLIAELIFGKNTIEGASFANFPQRLKLLNCVHYGLIVNGSQKFRLSRAESYRNFMLVANSGAGKSSRILINNLLAQRKNHLQSCFVLDVSGELFEKTSGYYESLGFSVHRVNLSNIAQSDGFNPLARCRTEDDAYMLSQRLIEASLGNDSKNAFWTFEGATLLSIVMRGQMQIAQQTESEEFLNLTNTRHLINNLSPKSSSSTMKLFAKYVDDRLFSDIKGAIASKDDKLFSNVKATALSALSLFTNTGIQHITTCESLPNFKEMRVYPTIIYLSVAEHEIQRFSVLIQLLVSELVKSLLVMPQEHDLDVNLFLDEGGSLGALIPTLATELFPYSRKRRISTVFVVQSLGQISILGNSLLDILQGGCFASSLYIPASSLHKDNKMISDMLGTQTTIDKEGRKERKKLIEPHKLFSMSNSYGLFFKTGAPPMKLKLYPYYKNRTFKKRSALPPYQMPSHDVTPVDLISFDNFLNTEL